MLHGFGLLIGYEVGSACVELLPLAGSHDTFPWGSKFIHNSYVAPKSRKVHKPYTLTPPRVGKDDGSKAIRIEPRPLSYILLGPE